MQKAFSIQTKELSSTDFMKIYSLKHYVPIQRAFILIMLIALTAVGCHDHSADTINIAGNKWLGYQPLFVAHHIANSGHHAKRQHDHQSELEAIAHQVSASILPSASTVMRVLGNQQLDAAMLTLDEAIQFVDKTSMDLCIGLVLDYSDGADALVGNPDAFKSINGKSIKIGYEPTALGGYLLRRSMEKLNIPASRIKPISLDPNDHISAYQSGQVDAVVTFQPYLNEIMKLGAEVVFSSSDIKNEIIDVMVVKKESWAIHKKHFHQLINILWASGIDYIQKNDDRAAKYVQSLTGTSEDLATSFQGIHLMTAEDNKKILPQIESTSIKKISEYMLKAGLISKPSSLTACE